MTTVRFTPRSAQNVALDGLQTNLAKMQQLQEQLSSGKALNRPSDSPVGTVQALQYRADIARTEQYKRNAGDGLSWLGIADDTLTSVLGTTGRVRELVLNGQNGALGPDERGAIAQEVDALRDTLIGLANTRYLDRPVFAGNAQTTNAYDPTTGAWQGSSNDSVDRRVAPGMTLRVNVTGTEVFGPAGNDLFKTLSDISNDLRNNPANLGTDLAALDNHVTNVENQLGTVGAKEHQVQAMSDRADQTELTTKTALSDVENIDLPKTIVDLQLQQVAYQSALAATSRIIQPSLLDFLR
ncbi:MAG: flagellar hook-associated protein FlgL [Acidobacteria bacterium]|nr:flagellar hook-associated protein FlgL [Acidobacteriota bacterium]